MRYFAAPLAAFALVGTLAGTPVEAVAEGQAAASVGCYSAGCNDKDPQTMGCGADAVTGARTTMPDGAVVELRWSDACQAAWGRISGARADQFVSVNGPNSQSHSAWIDAPGQTSGWTTMVMDRSIVDTAYACGNNGIVMHCTVAY